MQVETHPCLLLVVDPPGDDGAAVEVDGAGGVVAAVQHHHGGRRHRCRALWTPRMELYTSEMILQGSAKRLRPG